MALEGAGDLGEIGHGLVLCGGLKGAGKIGDGEHGEELEGRPGVCDDINLAHGFIRFPWEEGMG